MVKNLCVSASKNIFVNKTVIHKIIFALKKEVKFNINSMQLNFVYDKEIQLINNEYLKHDFSTDIITFNYSGENDNLEGEIFISVDDAFQNSKNYSTTLDNEIIRLVIHGILHLIGYDDIDPNDKKIMKAEENRLVELFSMKFKGSILKYGN